MSSQNGIAHDDGLSSAAAEVQTRGSESWVKAGQAQIALE